MREPEGQAEAEEWHTINRPTTHVNRDKRGGSIGFRVKCCLLLQDQQLSTHTPLTVGFSTVRARLKIDGPRVDREVPIPSCPTRSRGKSLAEKFT